MSRRVQELDDQSFASTIEKGVVLVDFYADWCGPCKVIAPVIEALAEELEGKVTIAKVDVGQAETTTSSFGITAVPTLIIFRDGKEVRRFTGMTMKGQLLEALQKAMA